MINIIEFCQNIQKKNMRYLFQIFMRLIELLKTEYLYLKYQKKKLKNMKKNFSSNIIINLIFFSNRFQMSLYHIDFIITKLSCL